METASSLPSTGSLNLQQEVRVSEMASVKKARQVVLSHNLYSFFVFLMAFCVLAINRCSGR